MLMKPPSIFDEVVSQDSQNMTAKSRQQSTKGKNARKETTLRIGGNSNEHRDRSFQHDNESVHSTGSRKSKGKQAKQSTLGRIKINEGNNHKEEDNQSVHSTGSRNSHKSGKKQSSIMQRPKIQQPLAKPKNQYERNQIKNPNKQPSFKQIFDAPEQSLIKVYQQQSPQPLRYYNDNQQQKVKLNEKQKKFAPFAEIQHKYVEEQVPIFRIQEPKNAKKNNVVSVSKPEENKFRNAIQRIQITQSKQYTSIDQSQTQFDNSKMGNTKSMRRPIFSREDNNASKVSNMIEQSNFVDQSNASGMQSTSRRKSNSRLRQIFNKSKEKNSIEQSCLPNQSKTSSFGDLQSQSRAIKPAVGSFDRMVQPERKVINDDEDNFGVDSIKSGLDLTVSNHQVQRDRDSLIFEFEPQKKKGMSVTSKNKKITQSQQQMIKINDNLISVKNDHIIPPKNENLPQIKTANMVSKDLTQINKLLKDNQEYLKNSGLLNLSDSNKTKSNRNSNEYLFNFEEQQKVQSPWKSISNRKQQPLNIKRVQRNQRSSKEKNEDISFKNALKEPILQNQVDKEPPFKKRIEEKIVPAAKKDHVSKIQENTQIYGRIQKNKQVKNDTLNIQPVWSRQTQQRNPKKQQLIKSPGKILKNYEQSPNSREEYDNKSQKSNKSGKKGKSVKQSAIPRDKKMKIQIKIDGPRAQQSFYQQSIAQIPDKKQQLSINDLSLYSKKQRVEEKKPNVYHFSDEDNEIDYKPKSRTDINFYDNEVRSNKPPSSRPPLSGKSAKSKSTSKDKVPKQSTLNIKGSNNHQKPQVRVQKTGGKKLTLMERAMMKHNQSEQDSQGSFSSREDNFSQNSRNTSNSKSSKKSIKQSSIKINKKESLIKNNNLPKPPIQKRTSSNSSSHQEEQADRFQQTNPQRMKEVPQRPIISKNCTFIDSKGRLVQKDLVIKGSDVYGQPRLEDSSLQAMQRMKRAKQNRRSRSRSRENKNQISRKKSREDIQSSSYDNSSYCSSFYENNTYNKGGRVNNTNNSLYSNREPTTNQTALKQFIKPVQQVPIYNQTGFPSKKHSNYYEQEEQPPRTLNDMFRKNGNANYQNSGVSNISQSRSKRSLKRTQKSASKKF